MSSGSSYDVSIWEEIRFTVERSTARLVESIQEEISSDGSLAQFHNKQPIPWQLTEVMKQRADAWVQRLYDLCCDAYKRHGKTVSADFDRAVWAYRVEHFIMGETDSQVHDPAMGGFLNLLLCAVGSPPEKRPSLKVGQKQCCFDVRTKVYGTWYDKLHHLSPRVDATVAALTRFNAMESHVARIVGGLSPNDPPLSPSTVPHPLARSEESLPPRASSSDPKIPTSAIEAAIDAEAKPDTQTPPLHIDDSLMRTVPVTKAPPPVRVVGGHGTVPGPKPTEVLSDLPVDYPRTLLARTFVIIGEAVRKFPVQTETVDLCKHVIAELTPHFRETLQNKVFRQDQALSTMYDLLHHLLVRNCDGEWRRSEIRKEVLRSNEWLALAREMAGEIDNDAPVKAGSIQQAQDAPEPGGLKAATWDAIEISFLSEERVQIRNGATIETRNYTEFGFEDRRSGKPNLAWKTLLALAAERGVLQNAATTGQKWLEIEKRIQEIRKVFRKHFLISADPVPFVEGAGYQAVFKISRRPSFDT